MEGTIALYLEKKMKKLGFQDFSFEEIKVTVNNTVLKIPASIDYYILFDVNNVVDNWTIEADNEYLTRDDFNVDGVPYITTLFSGNIEIDTTGAANQHIFLFVKVTPEFSVELKTLEPEQINELNSNTKDWKFSRVMNFIEKTRKLLQPTIPKKHDTSVRGILNNDIYN